MRRIQLVLCLWAVRGGGFTPLSRYMHIRNDQVNWTSSGDQSDCSVLCPSVGFTSGQARGFDVGGNQTHGTCFKPGAEVHSK